MFWERLGWGDGFDIVPDPVDSRYGYSSSQGGGLIKYDRLTGALSPSKPQHPEGKPMRYNWNAGIAVNPIDKSTLYYGSQYLLKSVDKGSSWEVISPDLTTNDPEKQKQVNTGGLNLDNTGAENHTSILTIAPSPVQDGIIWVGTDDGNVQLTRDGGASWENVVGNMKGVPAATWVAQIQASTYNAGEAFVTFDDHRRDNWEPYIYQTKDFGKTWKRLVDKTKVWGYALSFAQDPVEPKLMFAGTEFGLYVSIDAGSTWTKWENGYPTVSTMDMVIHPREHDLVIGTFGRAVWVLDDIRPLRALAAKGYNNVVTSSLELFDLPDGYIKAIGQNIGYRSTGHAFYVGENKPWGASISYFVDSVKEKKKVKIQIIEKGDTIRTLYHTPEIGFNRTYWNFERDGVRRAGQKKPTGEDTQKRGGRTVLPGEYSIRVSYNDASQEKSLQVLMDPRLAIAPDVLQKKATLMDQVQGYVQTTTEMVDRIDETVKIISDVKKLAKAQEIEELDSLNAHSKKVSKSLKTLRESIMGPTDVQGIYRDVNLLNAKIGNAGGLTGSILTPVTPNQEVAVQEASKRLAEVTETVNDFFDGDWIAYRSYVESLNLSFFKD